MSDKVGPPTLLMASLPKRTDLNAVMIFVNRPPDKSHYAKTAHQWLVLKCRMLIFADDEILCSPVLFSETHLYSVVSKTYLASGKMKRLLERHGMSENGCRNVTLTDSILQACLQYTLQARMAPKWNQVGTCYLVQGRNFLMETVPMNAVKIHIIVQGDSMVISINPISIRMPHLKLSDLGLGPETENKFISQDITYLSSTALGCEWISTLPWLRNARVISVSHNIPSTCPMLNYREMKRHWKNMYGYRLPEEQPNSSYSPAGPYITITFKNRSSATDVSYTYPALCVRPQGPIFLRNVDQGAIIQSFTTDLLARLTKLCGLPFKPSLKFGHSQVQLTPALNQVPFDSSTTPQNFIPVTLNSLPSGWKPSNQTPMVQQSQLFSQNTQIHTQNWKGNVPSHTRNMTAPSLPSATVTSATMNNTQVLTRPVTAVSNKNDAAYMKVADVSHQVTNSSTPKNNMPLSGSNFKASQLQPNSIIGSKPKHGTSPQQPHYGRTADRQSGLENQFKMSIKYGATPQREDSPCQVPRIGAEAGSLQAFHPLDNASSNNTPTAAFNFNPVKQIKPRDTSKWEYPKPKVPPIQDKLVSSSEPETAKKFSQDKMERIRRHIKETTENIRKGENTLKQIQQLATNFNLLTFKNPAMYLPLTSMCQPIDEHNKKLTQVTSSATSQSGQQVIGNKIFSNLNVSGLGAVQTSQTLRGEVSRSSFSAQQKKTLTKKILKYEMTKDHPVSDGLTPTKKPRAAKPELTSAEVAELAKQGKIDSVSAPVLVKWLRENNISCKSRDKKSLLVTKVLEHFGIVTEQPTH